MRPLLRSEERAREFRTRYRDTLTHWPVACEHLRIATSQGETFVVACGPKDAPPPILLHGPSPIPPCG